MMPRPAPAAAPIGIIGLGLLGSALLDRLRGAGWPVVGWDIDQRRIGILQERGGTAAAGPAEVFADCRRILLSLPTHREVAAVVGQSGGSPPGERIIIDTTTGDPASTERIAAELHRRGVTYLDATISGSSAQLREGRAALMVGGELQAFTDCGDIFRCLGGSVFHTGPVGTGAKMKLVTNLVLGLNRAALAEGLALADSMGLDLEMTLAVMRGSAAYSKIMDSKGERMIRGDFVPEARLSQHLKDVRLIIASGQQAGLPMPLSIAHRAVLEAAESAGCGELDNSSIIKVLGPQRRTQP